METGVMTNNAQDDISSPADSQTDGKSVSNEATITSSVEGLQSDEQRSVLDTVAQIRKCGLESVLSLPQLVVCGDQSSGKSSVLEALTETPFPRNCCE
jgi:GTP1/Obg family GTP-binding protein